MIVTEPEPRRDHTAQQAAHHPTQGTTPQEPAYTGYTEQTGYAGYPEPGGHREFAGHLDATAEHPTQPAPARLVAGRYALRGEIGRGGMGVVWHAQDQVIGRDVAIKELRVQGSGSDTDPAVFSERVMREVRTSGKLNDPAVVTVYDVLTEGGATYIVMELVAAPTLSQLIAERGPLPSEQVAAIGQQVLSALRTAHEAGVVHRDVKPGNILVLPNGRVKLTDFGIAQAVDDPRLTTSGILVGSPAFMAPERVNGADATPASDLWALGVTLFYAVEGSVAFERGTTAATLNAILNDVPYLTRCGGALASAISGLLVTSPEARLTAQQTDGLLQVAAQQSPPGGSVQAGFHQAGPQYTAQYTGQPMTAMATGPQQTPAPASPRSRKPLVIAGALAAVALVASGVAVGALLFTPGPPDRAMDPTLTYGKQGDIPEFSFSTSDDPCFVGRLESGRHISASSQTDCDELHDFEVFSVKSTLNPPDSTDDYPDVGPPAGDVLAGYGESWCAMHFASERVTWHNKEDALRYRALVPTEDSWRSKADEDSEGGRRGVYCVVYRANGQQFTGSVRASNN